MLSRSRFNRRLHRLKALFLTLFSILAEVWKDLNTDAIYSLDSFPIPACDNIRIPLARLYPGNDYYMEDVLPEADNVSLQPMRKKNSKRPFPPYIRYLQHHYRKLVETAGNLIERLLPKSIHAVTATGFELRIVLFVLALSLNCL